MISSKHSPKCVLVTGGAGFIGCNFVRHLLGSDPQVRVIVYDALTYAGNLGNLGDLEKKYGSRYRFIHGDICDSVRLTQLFDELSEESKSKSPNTSSNTSIDTIVHFAAESHVDRSIDGPGAFMRTNIEGTFTLLQVARKYWNNRTDVRFHHVSTDEVYGSLGDSGFFTEATPYDPSSPYSASKASSDHLVRAWHRTFGLPVTITNCSNNYGPYQFPEKLIPLMIASALQSKPLPVYGDGKNIRDWLYVEDHCRAVDHVIRLGEVGSTYNIGGHNEWTNISIVHLLCDLLDEMKPRGASGSYRNLITFVKDRPGHDRRYAIDAGKIQRELGWVPQETFNTGLRKTISWYLENQNWVESIMSGKYKGERLGSG